MKNLRCYIILSGESVAGIRIGCKGIIIDFADPIGFFINRQLVTWGTEIFSGHVTILIGRVVYNNEAIYYRCAGDLPDFQVKRGNLWLNHRQGHKLMMATANRKKMN